MDAPNDRRHRWLVRGLFFGLWTGLGVFFATQASLLIYSAGRARDDLKNITPAASFDELLRCALAECYLWAGLSWFIIRLARRFPLDLRHWGSSLLVHLPASVVFAFVQTTLSAVTAEFVRHELPKPTITWGVLEFFFFAKLHQNVFLYFVIVAVALALEYYRRYRDRELRATQLEARLAEAQLQVLKMQLHPHFLFNTLNAISALVHQDVELADRMIARLGDLLRSTLENAGTQEVSLRQELEFIRPYLEIEQARLGPRLNVEIDVDPAGLDARVPNLLLQPLVENAIRHGIAPRSEPGRIEIHAHRQGASLELRVRDDGPGLTNGAATVFKKGVGLANTRARLEQLYGPAHTFALHNGAGQGLEVAVTIPYHEDELPSGSRP